MVSQSEDIELIRYRSQILVASLKKRELQKYSSFFIPAKTSRKLTVKPRVKPRKPQERNSSQWLKHVPAPVESNIDQKFIERLSYFYLLPIFLYFKIAAF